MTLEEKIGLLHGKVGTPFRGEPKPDGAVGSAGFLCEAYDYLKSQPNLTTADLKTLQERTFYGQEKKSLAYVIAIMNMILHGIEAPNVIHTNTLSENLADIQEKDRFDVVLANPPFGGKERKEVQQNFPIRTGETAFLFLQHFIKILKAGGRGGIVIKNTFLSNTDNASVSLRKMLLESCNLHAVLDLPGGTFQGAGVKTVVLFFEKGTPMPEKGGGPLVATRRYRAAHNVAHFRFIEAAHIDEAGDPIGVDPSRDEAVRDYDLEEGRFFQACGVRFRPFRNGAGRHRVYDRQGEAFFSRGEE